MTAKTLAGLSLFEEADLVIRLSHEAQARFPDIRLVLNPQRGHVVIYFKEHVSVIRQATVMCEFARDFGVSPEVLWSGGETTVQND